MKIGITHTGRSDKHMNYVRWIKGNDNGIEIVALTHENADDVAACDALVLSGGVDMHPQFYAGPEKYAQKPAKFNLDRDRFEMQAFKTAVQHSIPVLGVCRGLQLINVCCNGTLVQDLADRNTIHQDTEIDRKHDVKVEEGSLLHGIVQVNAGMVNSAHHQCIDTIGNNLIANSYSDDGVIEGIEWKEKNTKPFMLAVQWHPERMDKVDLKESPFSKNVRDYFLSQVKPASTK